MSQPPRVSVAMPVRNAGRYLDTSIGSILAQTYRDFEFVIVDDASEDDSWERIQEWGSRDERIRALHSAERLGPAASSNLVARATAGELIARMDADDWSHPRRLEKTVAVLDGEADAVLVGSLCEGMDANGRLTRPLDRSLLRSTPPCPHGSVVYRRWAFERLGGYRECCAYWEDFDLYVRLAREGRLLVLPEALYRLRFHAGSGRQSQGVAAFNRALLTMRYCREIARHGGEFDAGLRLPVPVHGTPWEARLVRLSSQLWDTGNLDVDWRWVFSAPEARARWAFATVLSAADRILPGSAQRICRVIVRARDWIASASVKDGPVGWLPDGVRAVRRGGAP
jgi:glycosyltransferase involved in cell wall biosynthesis